jgi:hypothetical protein
MPPICSPLYKNPIFLAKKKKKKKKKEHNWLEGKNSWQESKLSSLTPTYLVAVIEYLTSVT